MSQPSRPQAHASARRRRRNLKLEAIFPLEDRCLLTPVVAVTPVTAVFVPAATQPANTTTGAVQITEGNPDAGFPSDAPFTSVNELTPISSFGGDIVTIQAGPGGVFGNAIYAISRGAGDNGQAPGTASAPNPFVVNTSPRTVSGAINKPGVIYRVDPATGKTNVFFDLNTVISQLNPDATPGNSVGSATGLVNWYSITFDPEGFFDGTPSMFVSSVDRSDPAKNAIYQISSSGTLLGVFASFTDGRTSARVRR